MHICIFLNLNMSATVMWCLEPDHKTGLVVMLVVVQKTDNS